MKTKKSISLLMTYLIILLPVYSAVAFAAPSATLTTGATGLNTAINKQYRIKIEWDAVTSSSFNHYMILRNNVFLENRTVPYFDDYNVVADTTYNYQIILVDNNGDTSPSISWSVRTPEVDTEPPELDMTVVEYTNQQYLVLSGSTETDTVVTLYVNGNFFDDVDTRDFGTYSFSGILLNQGSNTLRFEAVDYFNNSAEYTFDVVSDTIPPDLTFDEVLAASTSTTITLTGDASEDMTVDWYITDSLDVTAPSKVLQLKTTTVEQNTVRLEWDILEVDDFDEYIIYRSDVGALAKTPNNEYTDDEVSSDITYTYTVAAMDQNNNIGEESDDLTVTTLSDGIDKDVPEAVLVVEPDNNWDLVAGSFSETITILDGTVSTVQYIATDLADNTAEETFSIAHDSEAPYFIEPVSIDSYSPSYDRLVDIKGQVSEKATILAYVNGDLKDNVSTDEFGFFSIDLELTRDIEADDSYSAGSGTISISRGPWINNIRLVAIDAIGQQNVLEGVIDYTLCGSGTWWDVDMSEVYPNILTPRLLLLGVEQIGFDIELDWRGTLDSPTISSSRVSRVMISPAEEEDYDHDWVQPPVNTWSTTNKRGYIQIPFVRDPLSLDDENMTSFEKETNISEHRENSCLLPGFGCIKLFLELEINFADTTGTNPRNQGMRTQKECIPIEIVIDKRLNPDIIPDKFLERSIEFLENSVDLIDTVLPRLQNLKVWLFWTCTVSWVGEWFLAINEKYACEFANFAANPDEKFNKAVAKRGVGACSEAYKENSGACETCAESIQKRESYVYNTDWVCQRIYCSNAPTLQNYVKEAQDDKKTDFVDGVDINTACAVYNTADLKYDSLETVYQKYDDDKDLYAKCFEGSANERNAAECCIYEYMREWDSACVLMDEAEQSVCLQAQAEGQTRPGCNRLWNSVAGFCEPTGEPKAQLVMSGLRYSDFFKDATEASRLGHPQLGYASDWQTSSNSIAYECVGTYGCGNYQKGAKIQESGSQQTLFYWIAQTKAEGGNAAGGTCIGTTRVNELTNPTIIYSIDYGTPDDPTNPAIRRGYVTQTIAGAEKINGEFSIQSDTHFIPASDDLNLDFSEDCDGENGEFEKIRTEFNNNCPSTQDREMTRAQAIKLCENIRTEAGISDKEYIVDPASSLLRSIQCACLPALTSYLSFMRNMFNAVKTCFETILLTGDGSEGACQAVLTQYICDLIYDLIACFTQKYSVNTVGNAGAMGDGGRFIGALTSAGASVGERVRGKYGDNVIYEEIFSQRKLAHAVCLFAFTGDWIFDVAGMLETEYTIPIESEALLYPATRKFVSANPLTNPPGLATHLYHLGIGLVSGADLDYEIYLQCSNTLDCPEFEGGRCDCANLPDPLKRSLSGGRLTAGDILGTGLEGDQYHTLVGESVRYDTAVIEWEWDNKDGERITSKKETHISQTGGDPPAYCEFDIFEGMFRCSYDIGEGSFAYFSDVDTEQSDGKYSTGERLAFDIGVKQQIPEESASCSTQNCEHTKYLSVRVFNQNRALVYDNAEGFKPLNYNGERTYELPENFIITEDHFNQNPATAGRVQCSVFKREGASISFDPTIYCAESMKISYNHGNTNALFTYQLGTFSAGDNPQFTASSSPFLCVYQNNIAKCGVTELKINSLPSSSASITIKKEGQASNDPRGCQSAAGGATWQAELTLYDARETGSNNWERGDTITVYQSAQQEETVSFTATCKSTSEVCDTSGQRPAGSSGCNCISGSASAVCDANKYCWTGTDSVSCEDGRKDLSASGSGVSGLENQPCGSNQGMCRAPNGVNCPDGLFFVDGTNDSTKQSDCVGGLFCCEN
ncbi:hypothetical protein GOV04_00630 [Candidatus Woesearchaeota archaeon]|nr:hypothetical protein [Candidatus Woesearchaeota archaeon]